MTFGSLLENVLVWEILCREQPLAVPRNDQGSFPTQKIGSEYTPLPQQ